MPARLLLAYTRNPVDCQYPHSLARSEGDTRIDFLHIGAGLATILSHSDFDTLIAGDAFFGRRTRHATGDGTQHAGNNAATSATDRATGNTTNHCTSAGTDIGPGAFDLHQANRFDGAHTHCLRRARFIAAVGVTGQSRSTTTQHQRNTEQAALENSYIHDSPLYCAATLKATG